MYYCSIEDAWGNNFNKKYFNYQSNLIQENTINEDITNEQENTINQPTNNNQQNQSELDYINKNISNSSNDTNQNISNELDNTNIISNQIKSNKSDLIKNKRILLEKEIEKKIEKIYKMKEKKNKLLQKKQQLKLTGGNTNSDQNNYILLGLLLLFIIDVFGNLSY